MTTESLRAAALAALLLAGSAAPGFAQTATTPPAGPADTAAMDDAGQDDGFDWGWIGLLGLLGLAGPSRRRDTAHRTTTSGTTTGTAGSTRL
jgi:hypothetical protein